MKRIALILSFLISLSVHAETKAWKFLGKVYYKTDEYLMTFKEEKNRYVIEFKGKAHYLSPGIGLRFFEEYGLKHEKDLLLKLDTLGGGDTAYTDLMGYLASQYQVNMPDGRYSLYEKLNFEKNRHPTAHKNTDVKNFPKLITYVSNSSKCVSFCTYLFLLGIERSFSLNARFGFHAASYGAWPGEAFDVPESYAAFGVAEDWLNEHSEYFENEKIKFVRGSRLKNVGFLSGQE